MTRLILLLAALVLAPAVAAAQAPALPGPLVEPKWVAENASRIVVLDVRAEPQSFAAEGHIPGSVLVNWREVRTTRIEDGVELEDMLPSAEAFAALMRKSGVNAGATIVVSSRGREPAEMFLATRLFWQLRYWGHDAVAVLDGGTGAWAVEGRPLARGAGKPPKPGNWAATAERKELLATTKDVGKAVTARSHALTDSRRIENYLGTARFKAKVHGDGHIPGAKFADANLFLHPVRPVRFRSPAELKQIVDGLGIDAARPMITYCDTGDWASGTWFVFHELLGNRQTRLYDGSMHAWTKDKGRPLTRFKIE